jgi:ribonuclease J
VAASGAMRWLCLGGVGEIGKNCYIVDIDNKLIVVDCGMTFPKLHQLGIDIVVPDFTWLVQNQSRLRGILLTHAHEDHIGSVAYLLQDLKQPPPVYGSRFTLALLRGKLAEFGLLDQTPLHEFKIGSSFEIAGIEVDTARVTHSIPESCSVALKTADGWYVHSGDFKLDDSPVDGKLTDFEKLAKWGDEGVLAVGVDVTNIEQPGRGMSETAIRRPLRDYVADAQGRVFVTTFASNIHRVQQAIDVAVELKRKVLILGRTMVDNVNMSLDLGFLKCPENVIVTPQQAETVPAHKLLGVLTGSQGEPMAAMARIANRDHRFVTVQDNDLFIFSARPIPGNENAIFAVIDDLFRQGAEVIYGLQSGVHASGHAYQEEIRDYVQILKPKFVIPVHGYYRHQMRFKKLARNWNITPDRVPIVSIGELYAIDDGGPQLLDSVKSGEIYISGDSGTDISRRVINERLALAEDGVLAFSVTMSADGSQIVGEVQLIARGFVPEQQSTDLLAAIKAEIAEAILRNRMRGPEHSLQLRNNVQNAIQRVIFQKTKINPVVLGMVSYLGEGGGQSSDSGVMAPRIKVK